MSSLDDAFVEDDSDEEKLARLVNDRVKIITEKSQIRADEEFEEMDRSEQTLCCMAAISAMNLKNVREEKKIGPSALGELCPIPTSTLKSKLKELDLLENEDGEYYLPGYNLDKAIEMLEEED